MWNNCNGCFLLRHNCNGCFLLKHRSQDVLHVTLARTHHQCVLTQQSRPSVSLEASNITLLCQSTVKVTQLNKVKESVSSTNIRLLPCITSLCSEVSLTYKTKQDVFAILDTHRKTNAGEYTRSTLTLQFDTLFPG